MVQSDSNTLVSQPRLLKILFSELEPSWSSMRRLANEYIHRRHKVPMLPYILELPTFVPHTSTVCPTAADIMSGERLVVAAHFHPTLDMPNSEASDFQAVCAFLLSASDLNKWNHKNSSLSSPLNSASRPHSIDAADNISSNCPAHSATHRTYTPSAFFCCYICCFSESHVSAPPFAVNGSAHVSDLPPTSIPTQSASVKTSPAATVRFQDSLRYLCDCLARRDAAFAVLDEKYIQRRVFVRLL